MAGNGAELFGEGRQIGIAELLSDRVEDDRQKSACHGGDATSQGWLWLLQGIDLRRALQVSVESCILPHMPDYSLPELLEHSYDGDPFAMWLELPRQSGHAIRYDYDLEANFDQVIPQWSKPGSPFQPGRTAEVDVGQKFTVGFEHGGRWYEMTQTHVMGSDLFPLIDQALVEAGRLERCHEVYDADGLVGCLLAPPGAIVKATEALGLRVSAVSDPTQP